MLPLCHPIADAGTVQSGTAEACIIHYTYGQDLNEDGTVFPPQHCPGPDCVRGFWYWDKRDCAHKYPPRNIPLPSNCQVRCGTDTPSATRVSYWQRTAAHRLRELALICRFLLLSDEFLISLKIPVRGCSCVSFPALNDIARLLLLPQGTAIPTMIAAINQASAALEPWVVVHPPPPVAPAL